MSAGPGELRLPELVSSTSCSYSQCSSVQSRFSNLRGVQWRINLGILPSSSSIEELRRVTADSRRKYACLRRHLLVDPPKDGNSSPNLVMDNPLSQNPDSLWGRFFRNAELEKMVDQDLSRLYPEHGSYFQTPACQGILRRILLLWCLIHPEYGHRQGMHELLAPLLYILHVDAQRLSQVRKLYEDHFTDKFDGMSFPENDLMCSYKSQNTPDSSNWANGITDESSFQGSATKANSFEELDSQIQTIVLLSDAYGVEGELGILLSERFMEHDAFCMFDAVMSGADGAVAMADYFSPSPTIRSHTGLPPVIEASSALYHLLSIVDSSLHSHLVELGVEPQYFALRWLRVLFRREFLLEDLLIIWDEIFASENVKSIAGSEDDSGLSCGVLSSPRGAFISAMAVSMLLHLRSSLLSTENATSCLQRLLNFPENINVKKLIEKAKSFQVLALDTSISSFPFPSAASVGSKSTVVGGYSVPSGSVSPTTTLIPDSYWEEKWRVLHKAEETRKESLGKQVSAGKKGSFGKLRFGIARAESDLSTAKTESGKKDPRLSVRRRLLEDLSQELGSEEDLEKEGSVGVSTPINRLSIEVEVEEKDLLGESTEQNDIEVFTSALEETCLIGCTGSEENSVFYGSTSTLIRPNDHENDSEKCSVSNLAIDDNDDERKNVDPGRTSSSEPALPITNPTDSSSQKLESSMDTTGKQLMGFKERKLSSKFQWFWKFGRNANEGISEKGNDPETTKSTNVGSNQKSISESSTADGCGNLSGFKGRADVANKNLINTMRNLGQSMLENIQVIESVFQQDLGQVESLENLSGKVLVGKGEVTAVIALKELRKISNLLSEM